MSSESEIEELDVEQLRVGRHFKMKSAAGTLAIHSKDDMVGVWIDSDKSGQMVGTIGFVAQKGQVPYVCLWPPRGYTTGLPEGKNRLPFALSANGLQVPHPDGTVTVLPLEKLAALVKQLAQ